MEPPGTTNDLLEPYIKINFNGSMVIHNKREQNKKIYNFRPQSLVIDTRKKPKRKKNFFFCWNEKEFLSIITFYRTQNSTDRKLFLISFHFCQIFGIVHKLHN